MATESAPGDGIGLCAYRATASMGGQVLADSAQAIRMDRPDRAPLLWFPIDDVRSRPNGACEIGEGSFEGYVAFDQTHVQVDLVDTSNGSSVRDVTVKRFPTWGDVADLIAVLDVEFDGDAWASPVRSDWRRPIIEGSQMLAQAIVAAGRKTSGRRAVSASMIFPRGADARQPTSLHLEEIAHGRTFSSFSASVRQAGRVCAIGTLLLDRTAPSVIGHQASPPDVAGPYDSVPLDMGMTGRDIRIPDAAYTGDPDAPVGPPMLDAWVKFAEVPADPVLHAALLAQFTGHMSIAAALRPHAGIGQDQAHRTLSTAINAISLSIHSDVRVDEWLLYRHVSTFAGDGMTHSECRVYTEAGTLVASFTVVAMVRAFEQSANIDHRTSM